MKRATLLALVLVTVSVAAQTPTSTPPPPRTQAPADSLPDTPSTAAQISAPAEPNGPKVVFDTTMGRMTCQFYQKEAPITVANFIGLAEGTKDFNDPRTGEKMTGVRFYDGTLFHRVIPHFMIQGGDRLGTGEGDPGFMFGDEINRGLRFDRPGRLAMANAGPGTNGSQYFITEDPVGQLNGKHTIFGQCDAHSVLLVQSIARVERNSNDKPYTPVVVVKVSIVREGEPMPAEPVLSRPRPAAPPAQ